jgi:cell division protein FtsW
VIGLVACYASLRMSVRFIRRVAFTGYVVTIILLVLVLVPGIGNLANGSRKWFVVAGLSMQPSELAKIAFAIWGAHMLAARRLERGSLRELLIPLVPAAVIALALIVAQPDLGQTVSLGIILLALLWYAGLPLRVFVSSLLAVFVAGAVLAMSAGYRSDRVRSWINPENDPQDTGYQARQAKFALAHGGVFGDGLGQGVAKWNYLPNTTSSSRSSARNSASSAPSRCWCCSGCSPTPVCGSPAARPTPSCGCSPPPRPCGCWARLSSTSVT